MPQSKRMVGKGVRDESDEVARLRKELAETRCRLNAAQERLTELTNYTSRLEQERGYLYRAVTQSMIVLEGIGPVPAHYCVTHKKKLPLSAFRLRATRRGKWAITDADGELVSFRAECQECESHRQGAAEAAHRMSLRQVVNRFVERSPDTAEKFWESFEDAYMREHGNAYEFFE